MAAYLTIAIMLLVLYLGLLGFVHRTTRGGLQYLVGVALLVVSIPFIAYAAFTVLPRVVNNLLPGPMR